MFGVILVGYMDGCKVVECIVEVFELDKGFYKIGVIKIFFKVGIFVELEERWDNFLYDIFQCFQFVVRMYVV